MIAGTVGISASAMLLAGFLFLAAFGHADALYGNPDIE
jgi:hypothetical protein